MSRTKIVATIGPVSCNPATLHAMGEAGMSVARLNGSHNTLDWHATAIALIRRELPDTPILLDIPGQKVRTGLLSQDVSFDVGDCVAFTTDANYGGNAKVPIDHPTLHKQLSVGATVLADDGTLRFTVTKIRGVDILCEALVSGTLRSRKGINLPGIRLERRPMSARDRDMITFARERGVDFIGISFVESAGDIGSARELGVEGRPRIVSKIETQGGLDRLQEIAAEADALMIDRGDLSAETSLETLAVAQKHILATARAAGKPVIVATEMLHTMITSPSPTKAEVTDITNAVLDGCAATMLSGETAIGRYPVEAVTVMRRIAEAAERYLQDGLDTAGSHSATRIPEATAEAVSFLCRALPITKIVAVTRQGYAPRMIAARQPRQRLLAVSNDEMSARSFNLLPGTEGVFVDIPFARTSTDHVIKCLQELWRRGKVESEDLVLVCALAYPRSGNRMNLLQTHQISDLVQAMAWTR